MNSSIDAGFDLNLYIEQGLLMLKEDMAKYGPVDFSGPYEEKNFYIQRANYNGVFHLLHPGRYWAAEVYYSKLLDFILEHERTTGQRYNKGMVLANLGLTQVRNEKFDSGVAYFMAADDEDRPFVDEHYTVLNTRLWEPFEGELIQFVVQFSTLQSVEEEYNAEYIKSFFRSLSVGDRLFLSGSLWSIMQNSKRYEITPNSYTRGRLYSALADLCLVTETLVRKKHKADGAKPPIFKSLLEAAIPGCVHDKSNREFYTTSTPSEFIDRLNILVALSIDTTRWISCLVLTRNYMAHHFDYLTDMLSTKDFFQVAYPKAMENTVLALLCLSKAGAL